MRSKRANEYLNRAQVWGSQRKTAEKAVERAEVDARERAVRAFKSTCGFYDDGRDCCCRNPNDPQRKCDCRCSSMEKFQNAYDND